MPADTSGAHGPESDSPGLDLARLQKFIGETRPGLVNGTLSARLIQGGRSNLTYLLGDGHASWVLRRPPLGDVLPTAHDMAREFRFLAALAPTGVAVPQTVLLCEDPQVIGASFYIMGFVEGRAYQTAAELAQVGPARTRAIADSLLDTMVTLHTVDPAKVGLADMGRPAGFLERQLRRWQAQLEASQSRDIPGIDALHRTLSAAVPAAGPPALVHGDYRLDNVLIDGDDAVAAVLDWEMATIGDPLTDLGLLIAYAVATRKGVFPTGVAAAPGYPGRDELVARYRSAGGRDPAAVHWYVALACYKLAVIAEGIHHRHTSGQTVGDGFESIGAVVAPMIELGIDTLQEG